MDEKKSIKVGLGTVISIFIIILLVVALGIVYYLGFVKNKQEIIALKDEINVLSNKSDSSQSEKGEVKTNNSNNVAKSNNSETNDISVVDAVDYSDGYYQLFKIKLPKIIGNTETIDELNKKILNEVLPLTYADVACHAVTEDNLEKYGEPTAMDKGSIYDYKYIIKNNILVICIYSSVPEGGSVIPATNGGLEYISYYYDIANDKILSMGEAARLLELNIKGLEKADGETIKTYDELEYNYIIQIEGNEIKLVNHIY